MVQDEVLYNADFAQVIYYPDTDILRLNLIGNIMKEDYQTAWNVLLDCYLEKQPKKVLIDQRPMSKASLESRAWFVVKWLPKFKKKVNQKIRVAVVLSKSIAMKIGGQFLVDAATKDVPNLEIKTSQNEEDALSWLHQIAN
ncbi:hypothetical protein FHS56_001895 [Thermonema lapsum]|uniref:STAS/SEC14 domain-containing protein n=1 Tax=Thermonema lapsum TaxID=28195 RepID=A0A846MSR7_9BACT|nr:STAS/SEC14 domain-containing protein [Thermonema lapsum]NIK74382.1 hypothetical protein [Thermonema lapsum]